MLGKRAACATVELTMYRFCESNSGSPLMTDVGNDLKIEMFSYESTFSCSNITRATLPDGFTPSSISPKSTSISWFVQFTSISDTSFELVIRVLYVKYFSRNLDSYGFHESLEIRILVKLYDKFTGVLVIDENTAMYIYVLPIYAK